MFQSEQYAREQRIARVRAIAGKYSDLYGNGYLEKVREGWPA